MNFLKYFYPVTQLPRLAWPVFLILGIILLSAVQQARADASNIRVGEALILAQADSSQAASRSDARAMVQLMNQLDSLNLELNKLRGMVEELSNSVLNAEKRQKDMYLDLDTRLRRIEQSNTEVLTESRKSTDAVSDLRGRIERLEAGAASANSAAPELAATTGTMAGVNTEINAAVSRDYEAAMQKYRSGEYQDAIKAFQTIVEQYPRHPLAVNAQYWTGDSYYQLGAYRSAIDAQKALMATYPNSAKTPDAMLNIGSALVGLGDVAGARQTWERLNATYPGSRAAANASERLKRLP